MRRDDAARYRAERACNDGANDVLDAERARASLRTLYRHALSVLQDADRVIDDRMRAFWTLRHVEWKGGHAPLIDIPPDFDVFDYMHAVVEAGVADGSLAAQHGETLAKAIRAAGFSRRERFE